MLHSFHEPLLHCFEMLQMGLIAPLTLSGFQFLFRESGFQFQFLFRGLHYQDFVPFFVGDGKSGTSSSMS